MRSVCADDAVAIEVHVGITAGVTAGAGAGAVAFCTVAAAYSLDVGDCVDSSLVVVAIDEWMKRIR